MTVYLQLCFGEGRLDNLQLHVLPGQIDPSHPSQIVGGVAPAVEPPPAALEMRVAHGGELVGDLPSGVGPACGSLHSLTSSNSDDR